MDQHNATAQDEVTLRELASAIARRKWLVIATTMALIFAALAYAFSIEPQWQGTVVVEIGRVGQVDQVDGASDLIESPERVVQRLSQIPFQQAVLRSEGMTNGSADDNANARLYHSSFSARALADSGLVSVAARAYSRADVQKLLQGTVRQLSAIHSELAQPTLVRLRQELAEVERQIKVLETRDRQLHEMETVATKHVGDGQFSEGVLLAYMGEKEQTELHELRNSRITYQEQLDPHRTYPTGVFGDVYVSEKPVPSGRLAMVTLAGLGGLAIGIVLALVLGALRPPVA